MRDLTFVTVGDGPEDVIFDDRGRVLTGLRNEGRIVRVDPDSGAVEEIAQVGGMPLGLDWLPDGRLLVCNAKAGLQAVDVATGAVSPVPVRGVTLHLANNPHVMPDGTIFVSDSSAAYPLEEYQKDIIEDTGTGKPVYRLFTRKTRL